MTFLCETAPKKGYLDNLYGYHIPESVFMHVKLCCLCWQKCVSIGESNIIANVSHMSLQLQIILIILQLLASEHWPFPPSTVFTLHSLLITEPAPIITGCDILSPRVTQRNYHLISSPLMWSITVFCFGALRVRKRWISWWCSATEGEQRQEEGEKKDTLISAKILQTWLPLLRLWNEMQHHKFCLKWNRLIGICWPSTLFMFLGKASDNVQSRTTKTCSTSQQHRFPSHLVEL